VRAEKAKRIGMKLLRHLHKAPLRVLRLQRRKSMIRIRFSMVRLKVALAQEKAETRQMLRIYQHYVTGDVSKAELARANAQLADVLRPGYFCGAALCAYYHSNYR
jgi:hypothetical protein